MLCIQIVEFDVFLVRPGDGEEFVYSPFGINATLNCIVNNTNLAWIVDMFRFEVELEGDLLYSRGISQTSGISEGIMESVVNVSGSMKRNNNTHICCRSIVKSVDKQACTTLIIYGIASMCL